MRQCFQSSHFSFYIHRPVCYNAFMLIDVEDKIHVVKEQKNHSKVHKVDMHRILLSKLTFSWPKAEIPNSSLLSKIQGVYCDRKLQ